MEKRLPTPKPLERQVFSSGAAQSLMGARLLPCLILESEQSVLISIWRIFFVIQCVSRHLLGGLAYLDPVSDLRLVPF